MTAAPRAFDIILSGDSLRLGSARDTESCVVTLLSGGEPDTDAAVRVLLPRSDHRAYARAARSFNRIMAKHEQRRPPEQREINPRHEALRAAVRSLHGKPADT